jgi:hypothetical protein
VTTSEVHSVKILKLHDQLYSVRSVEEAAHVYSGHAQVAVQPAPPYFEVSVSSDSPEAEGVVAGELANYALALTVEARRTKTDR